GAWKTDTVPGQGGYGVSLALDKDGNPIAAYYDAGGGVHEAHSSGGKTLAVSDVASPPVAHGPIAPSTAWGTGTTLDDKGTDYVTWAGIQQNQILVATDQGGQFKPIPVQGSLGGANPSIAVSADGKKQAVAWFDPTNANLDVASTSTGGLVLAFPLPTLGPPTAPVQPTGSTPPCQP